MRALLLTMVLTCGAMMPGLAVAQNDAQSTANRLGNEVQARPVNAQDSDVNWGRAVGVVNAPFERVRGAVRNYSNYRHFLPFFTQSRIESSRGARSLVYVEARVMHGAVRLWANMMFRSGATRGETEIIEGRMAEGNMDEFRARWELTPIDDGQRTLVVLQVLIDPGLPLPDSVCSSENVSSAHRTIRALRRFLGVSPPRSS